MAKDDRLALSIGEIYRDLLVNAAFQTGKSEPQQAASILCSSLMSEEQEIRKINDYLAWKRGITPQQLWLDVIEGKAKPLSREEIGELRQQGLIDENSSMP